MEGGAKGGKSSAAVRMLSWLCGCTTSFTNVSQQKAKEELGMSRVEWWAKPRRTLCQPAGKRTQGCAGTTSQ